MKLGEGLHISVPSMRFSDTRYQVCTKPINKGRDSPRSRRRHKIIVPPEASEMSYAIAETTGHTNRYDQDFEPLALTVGLTDRFCRVQSEDS